MKLLINRFAPWVMLVLVLPTIFLVNMFFMLLFPASHQSVWDQVNPLSPQNSTLQVGYVYPNRSPKEVFAKFYYVLGTQLASRGQVLVAENLLSQAVRWMPEDSKTYLNYAVVLESLDKHNEAQLNYLKALELDPNLMQANYNLALLYDKLGDSQSGIPYLQAAHTLEPMNPSINYDLGVLYAKINDFYNSAKYSELAVKSEKDFAEAYNNYGYALAHIGKHEQALEAINKSLELKPNNAATMDSKGFVYFGMGRYEEALAEYEKALQLDPTIGEIHLHIAQVMEKLNRIPESIAAYERYIQLSPQAPDKVVIQRKIGELKKWNQQREASKPSSG